MSAPEVPANEVERLAALETYGDLDTFADESLDALVRVAARVCDVPIAVVSLVDANRQKFVAETGLAGVGETSREVSFCGHAILNQEDLFVVPDAREDLRFRDNPLVTGDPKIRFYAGSPLIDESGAALGTLCVIDRDERVLSPAQTATLRDLSQVATRLLGMHRATKRLERVALVEATMRAMLAAQTELLVLAEQVAEVGHWRLDVKNERLSWSPQTYKIMGLDPSSFVPDLVSAVAGYHPDDRSRVMGLVQRAVERGEDFQFELRIVRPTGEVRHVHARGRCEQDHAGSTVAIFGVFQDVTERDALRERLILHERLATVGTLAAGVGHEINNPLAAITGNVDYLLDEIGGIGGGSASTRVRELVEVVREVRAGADRIRNIVRGLGAFASVEPVSGPTDVEAAIHVAANMAGHEVRVRARLDLRLPEQMPLVLADEGQLSQILVSLLMNASQAFPGDDPATNLVTVTATTTDEGVVIEVADNGPGIAPAIMGRIFDPFFTTKPPGKGTGLGLSISRSLATSLGGALTCTAVLGQGATFRLILPAHQEPARSPST